MHLPFTRGTPLAGCSTHSEAGRCSHWRIANPEFMMPMHLESSLPESRPRPKKTSWRNRSPRCRRRSVAWFTNPAALFAPTHPNLGRPDAVRGWRREGGEGHVFPFLTQKVNLTASGAATPPVGSSANFGSQVSLKLAGGNRYLFGGNSG